MEGSGGKGQHRHLCSRRRGKEKVRALPTATDSETPPAPISPETAPAQTRTLAAPTVSRSRVAPPPPRPPPVPAGSRVREALGQELLSGPGHFRGARRVSPPLQEDDVDAEKEEEAAEACLLSRPLPSPELAPNVRAR